MVDFTCALSALGHQLKEIARPGQSFTGARVSPAGGTGRSTDRNACLLPWQTMIKPSPHQRVAIDAHSDDWP
jgi:hypothetical protein